MSTPTPSTKQVAENAWRDPDMAAKYARSESATSPYAKIMVQQADTLKTLNTDNDNELNVLDLACGTGALTAALYSSIPRSKWDKVKVIGGDISESMLTYMKERGEKEGWPGLETRIMDLNELKVPEESLTHLFLNFGIFFSPPEILKTYYTLLKPGGFIAISTWQHLPWYALLQSAAERLPAGAPPLPTLEEVIKMLYSNRDWDQEAFLTSAIKEGGFEDVIIVVEDREAHVGTPEQFVESMGMPLKMITGGWGKEEERGRLVEQVTAKLLEVVGEMAEKEEDGVVRLVFKGMVGVGRKRS